MKTEFDSKLELNKEEVRRHGREGDDKVKPSLNTSIIFFVAVVVDVIV